MFRYEIEELRQAIREAHTLEREWMLKALEAEREALGAKVVWEDAEYIGLATGTIAGKNPEERKGNARLMYAKEYGAYRETESKALEAKSHLAACHNRVEELERILRTYEVAVAPEPVNA